MTAATSTERAPFIRGKKGVYKLCKNPFGSYYRKIDDPKGVPEPENLEYFYLNHNLAKIPQHLVQAIVGFFRAYLREERGAVNYKKAYTDSTTEVQVCLLLKEDDPSEWKVVVPRQVVGSVTVDARTNRSCDILTGEEYDVFPPVGWLHCGSMHRM